jgi:hypothetical protein
LLNTLGRGEGFKFIDFELGALDGIEELKPDFFLVGF